MLRILYRIIWTFGYYLLSFVCFFKCLTVTLHKKWIGFFKTTSVEDELKMVANFVKRMEKLPEHVVFVLGDDSISFRDLGNVIVWCIAAGVSFLSFYDFGGKLKKEEAHLYNAVMKIHKKYSGNIVWGEKTPINGVLSPNGTKNGMDFLRKVKVNIFSLPDGKGNIAGVAYELCQSVKENKLKLEDINQDVIDRMIQVRSGVPDPDLAVLFGSSYCTYGLLPWQIRVTEFVKMQTHHNITVKDFISILQKYSKCEQRFGK